MRGLIILNILLFFQYACKQELKTKTTYRYDNTFSAGLKVFKVRYKNVVYPVVLEERTFYYMLKDARLISNDIAYFKYKKVYWKFIVSLDSTTYNNIKSIIVFNSIKDNEVKYWVNKLKTNQKDSIEKKIVLDTSLCQIDRINIYYHLLEDGFKIVQDDLSGYYYLKK